MVRTTQSALATSYLGFDDRNAPWKLPYHGDKSANEARQILKTKGFSVLSSSNRGRVMAQLYRMERGLLCYNGRRRKHLERFLRDRRLEPYGLYGLPRSSVELIAELEAADDKATFPQLVRLPPEMRVRIYEAVFQGSRPLSVPREHPLC